MINWVAFASILFTCVLSGLIINKYSSSKARNKVLHFSVFLGFTSAFCLIGLVPYDIYITKNSRYASSDSQLFIMWQVLFWISFMLCWFLLPIIRIYEISGQFNWKSKIKNSIYTQLKEFLVVGIIGLGLLIFILVKSLVNIKDLPKLLAFLSNTWGLFLIMVFLGYGVVAVPRHFWKEADFRANMCFLYVRLVNVDEEVTLASGSLDDCVKKICAACIKVPRDSLLHDQIEEVFNLCPVSLREYHMSRPLNDIVVGVVTESRLAEFHSNLKVSLVEYKRAKCEWTKCIKDIIEAEDIIKAEHSPNKRIEYSLRPNSNRSGFVEYIDWVYTLKVKPVLYKFLSVVFTLLSILVILGETTMFLDFPIGVFPLLVKQDFGLYVSQLLTLFPLGYIIFCTYFAFFNLKLPGLYGMYTKNTEPCSLAYCAFYLTRLSAPLALNFFYLVKVTDAVFWDVIVSSNAVGSMFEALNTYFPISLLVFALLNYLNTYSKILSLLGVNQLSFIDETASYKIQEGKTLVKREKINFEKDLKKFTDWEMSSLEIMKDSGYGVSKL